MKSNQTKKMPQKKSSKFLKIYTTNLNFDQVMKSIPKGCYKGDGFSDFLTGRIFEFAKNKIIPSLEAGKKSKQKNKCISIKAVDIEGSEFNNIELLEKFADLHKTSVAEIVYLYILFPILEKEYLIKKLNGKC